MKWVWQDYDKPITAGANPKQPVMDIILPDQPWEVVSEGHKFTEGTTADADGNIYFTDIPNNQIWKIGPDGKPVVFAHDTQGANGLKISPDGRLFACQGDANRIVAYDVKTAKETVIAEGIEKPNDLVISNKGDIYVTEPPLSQVWHISPTGEKKVVIDKKNGIVLPNGVGLTPDQSQLIVVDTKGCNFWIYFINADGTLAHGAPFYTAQIASTDRESGADGLCIDTAGRLYVATRIGIQVFDQAGRVIAIIPKPQDARNRNQWLANLSFGGKDFDELYIACGDKIYRRKTKASGALGFETPTKPQRPHL
jgi:sugar lactone lactonase YvrE